MSYYYNYYLGYEKENKFYPLGPYDHQHIYHPVISKSASFASDLYEDFHDIPFEKTSKELFKELAKEDWNGKKDVWAKYMYLSDLPKGDGLIKGYVPVSDIQQYLKDEDPGCVKYSLLTPEQYAIKASLEIKNGPPSIQKDEEGEEFENIPAKDYVYFAFFDEDSEEYESKQLREAAMMFDYTKDVDYDLKNVVVFLTEG